MKRLCLCTLLLCCAVGCAGAQSPFPQIEGTAYYWEVLPLLLRNPDYLCENAVGGGQTVIEYAQDITHIGECRNVDIEGNILDYSGGSEADTGQAILVKFRVNNDSGLWFSFCSRDYAAIVMNLAAPQFPAVGMSSQPEKYRHFGNESFTFAEGAWYMALFAVDPQLELGLWLWQEGTPGNMAGYRTNLARDDWYAGGADFAGRRWSLTLNMSYVDPVDIDLAGYRVIGFAGFAD